MWPFNRKKSVKNPIDPSKGQAAIEAEFARIRGLCQKMRTLLKAANDPANSVAIGHLREFVNATEESARNKASGAESKLYGLSLRLIEGDEPAVQFWKAVGPLIAQIAVEQLTAMGVIRICEIARNELGTK